MLFDMLIGMISTDYLRGVVFMKKTLCLILSIVMVLTALAPYQSIIAAEINKNSIGYFSDSVNEMINTYDKDEEYTSDSSSNQALIKDRLIVSSDKVSADYGAVSKVVGLGYTILQYDTDEDCKTAKERLIADGFNAEYDSILSCADVNSTESTSRTWGNDRIESKETLNAIKASGKKLSEVTVGIIDTGVDYTHPDLKDRIVDTSLNFSSSGKQNNSMDDQGHGTMVAGIVMQNTTDNVKIKPYKVLNKDGKCATSQIISVVNHILAEKDAPAVINLSLGGESNKLDQEEKVQKSLIESLIGKGCTVVVAAGNESSDAGNYSPSNISNVITVSASTSKNTKSPYSNYGGVVDIAAPGDNIYTTNLGGGYISSHSGTSFSAPFVTAAAATVLMLDNSLTSMQVENKIKDAAFPIVNNTGVEWCGAGILNYSALYEDMLAPAPTFSQESGAYNDIISLTASAENGYTIRYTTDNTIPTLNNGETFDGTMTIEDSKSFVAVAINESGKSKYIPLSYSVIYLADENDFEITDKGVITAYNGIKNSIIVPDSINGITPIRIGKSVFEGVSIKSIVLPESINEILMYAFRGCSKLESITALGLEMIDNFVFTDCSNLTKVNMPNVYEIGAYCFSGCKKLETVDFNESLEKAYTNAFSETNFQYAYFPKLEQGYGLFANTPLISADLPEVFYINSIFENCYYLETVYFRDLIYIENYAFKNCEKLTKFDFSSITRLGAFAFAYSCFEEISLPNCKDIKSSAGLFQYSKAKHISVPYLETVSSQTFYHCENLEILNIPNYKKCDNIYDDAHVFVDCFKLKYLYLPNAEYMPPIEVSNESYADKMELEYIYAPNTTKVNDVLAVKFFWCCKNLKWAYLPKLTELNFVPQNTEATIYLSDALTITPGENYSTSKKYFTDLKVKIVAPINSKAHDFADNYNLTFIPSDSRDESIDNPANVTDLGRSICCSAAGVRFGFTWDNIDEIESLASDIEYGFIYSQKGAENLSIDTVDNKNIKKAVANNRVNHGDTTSFNLVISNIPTSYYDREITARAYVCIDGMYFYSNIRSGSFSEVANLVLADEEIDENTKNAVKNLLSKEV